MGRRCRGDDSFSRAFQARWTKRFGKDRLIVHPQIKKHVVCRLLKRRWTTQIYLIRVQRETALQNLLQQKKLTTKTPHRTKQRPWKVSLNGKRGSWAVGLVLLRKEHSESYDASAAFEANDARKVLRSKFAQSGTRRRFDDAEFFKDHQRRQKIVHRKPVKPSFVYKNVIDHGDERRYSNSSSRKHDSSTRIKSKNEISTGSERLRNPPKSNQRIPSRFCSPTFNSVSNSQIVQHFGNNSISLYRDAKTRVVRTVAHSVSSG